MFKNYLMTAFRNIRRHKGYAGINIAGLAIGIACCTLILLWVSFEFSFDSFHHNAGRIYRVAEQTRRSDGYYRRRASTGTPLGPALIEECPAAEAVTRLYRTDALISCGVKGFSEKGLMFADSSIFDIFSFALLKGDQRTALSQPFTVVITPEFAHKYFGDADPIGRTLTYENRREYTVTGILAPIPANSHLQFQFLASLSSLTSASTEFAGHWDAPVYTYVLVREGFSLPQVESQLPALIQKYRGADAAATVTLWLQPLLSIHLHSNLGGELEDKTDISTLYQYAGLALFILLVACVNFINLATAQASRRAREVGMRKVLGGSRADLIRLYLGESIVIAGCATIIAIVLVEILKPIFSSVVGAPLTLDSLPSVGFWLGLVAVPVVVGAAGIFPAFYLSAVSLAEALQGATARGPKRAVLRKVLVVFQFAVTSVLLVCTMIGYSQLGYLLNKDLGFDKNGLVIVPIGDYAVQSKQDALKSAFEQREGVVSVTSASNIPGDRDCYGLTFRRPDGQGYVSLPVLWVDPTYARTLDLSLLQGKDFESGSSRATGAVLLSESTVRALNLSNPVGQQLQSYSTDGNNLTPMYESRVIGVARDFNFRDLSYTMQPLVIMLDPGRCEQMLIRIREGSESVTLNRLREAWTSLFPNRPFMYSFLDDRLAANYGKVRHFTEVLNYSSFLAMLVACIGLFGLASFVIVQRTKEIGLRRVLGASSSKIVSLLSREFLLAVAIANVVAWPMAYLLMRWWLQGFIYRVGISPGLFLLTGISTFTIAYITIGYQAVRAARANPVNSLKYE